MHILTFRRNLATSTARQTFLSFLSRWWRQQDSDIGTYQCFRRTFCFHFHGKGEERSFYSNAGGSKCHFYSEDGGNSFLRIVCTYLPDFTASYPSILSLHITLPPPQLLPIHRNVTVPCCQIIIITVTKFFTVVPWTVTGRMRQLRT